MKKESCKLAVGDVIKVHGFVMLKGLDDGFRYEVEKLDMWTSISTTYTYTFRRIGSKFRVRHFASSVDSWINETEDLNRIQHIV